MKKIAKFFKAFFQKGIVFPRSCRCCCYFRTGHIDRQVNFVYCQKGHRLIDGEEMTETHRVSYDQDSEEIRVTRYGWHDSGQGEGPAMLTREDCNDWRKKRFKLELQ